MVAPRSEAIVNFYEAIANFYDSCTEDEHASVLVLMMENLIAPAGDVNSNPLYRCRAY